MQITEKIEKLLKHAFPEGKTGQEEYIDLCRSIYCENPLLNINPHLALHLTYGIHWDNSEKCTVFISLSPISKNYILPIQKHVPIKYTAGGIHQLYVVMHSMTCSLPSSMWIQCEINRKGFKTPIEMYKYIMNTIHIGVINVYSYEPTFIPLINVLT